MKNIFSIILIFFAVLVAMPTKANACWCRNDPEETNTPKKLKSAIRKSFRYSSVVFSGTVTEQNTKHLKFEVKQLWKGKDQTEIFFTSSNYIAFTESGERLGFLDSCAYNFKVGESYLVYANLESGELEVAKCGRTQILANASQDIEELNLSGKRNGAKQYK
ncbi:MAG: hypothetical protein ABI954_06040 [Pyrinomonadaceae bacterium]